MSDNPGISGSCDAPPTIKPPSGILGGQWTVFEVVLR